MKATVLNLARRGGYSLKHPELVQHEIISSFLSSKDCQMSIWEKFPR